jgi:hypothetical protein
MRPPIREICDDPFVATDRPGWRAYSGTPLPDRPSRQKPDRNPEGRSTVRGRQTRQTITP